MSALSSTQHLADSTQKTRYLSSLKTWVQCCVLYAVCGVLVVGCATPEYAVRPTPHPVESPDVVQIERAISAAQAREFEQQGARPLLPSEWFKGFNVPTILARLSPVTERPYLPYRALLYRDAEPNAASLADGRVYISSGMLEWLAKRGGRQDELAFVLAHELGHTVAQHLVQRYQQMAKQQVFLSLVTAGAALATSGGSAGAHEAGQLAVNAASLLSDVAASGFSQQQELEADQLGVRYMMRAGFRPQAALDVLAAFERMETPTVFLSTHPYARVRREYLARYLSEVNARPGPVRPASSRPNQDETAARIRTLREAQRQYPQGSVSWKNLQGQLEALEQRSGR